MLFCFRKWSRPLFSDGVLREVRVLAQEVEVLQATYEFSGLFCNHTVYVGPCDRGAAGTDGYGPDSEKVTKPTLFKKHEEYVASLHHIIPA